MLTEAKLPADSRINADEILAEYRRKAVLERGAIFLRIPLKGDSLSRTHLQATESLLETLLHVPVAIAVFPEFLELRSLGQPGPALQALGAIACGVTEHFVAYSE